MIDARIRIESPQLEVADELDRYASQHAELIRTASELAEERGKAVVRVEVEYPTDRPGTWDVSGDALEIDFADPLNPSITTLPPYAEVQP